MANIKKSFDWNDKAEMQLDSLYFTRELTQILPGIVEARRAPRSAERLIPLSGEYNSDMETYVRRAITDVTGVAHEGTLDASPTDVPMVEMDMKEEPGNFWSAKLGWYMTYRQRRMARLQSLPVDTFKAKLALEGLFDKENDMLWNGSSLYNKPGILATAGAPSALGAPFFSATADAATLLAGLNKMAEKIDDDTNGAYRDRVTLVLPRGVYNRAAKTPRSNDNDTTVLSFFQRNDNGLVASVTYANELTDKALAFVKDPMMINHGRVPVYQVGPVEEPLRQRVTTHYELRSTGIQVIDSHAIRLFQPTA